MTRRTDPTEQQIQAALFAWADAKRIENFFSIPNGGSRNKIEAVNLKRAGVRAGVPDMMLAIKRKGYGGLFIELKRDRTCKPSPEQTDWLNRLTAAGYFATVCHGLDSAVRTVEWYLGGTE